MQDTLPISVVQKPAENRPTCSSGGQTNARGFCYDEITEAQTGTPQTRPALNLKFNWLSSYKVEHNTN